TPLLGYRLGPVEILLALGCFSITPLITAIAVWAGRRQSQTARGPVTYVFDAEGMHTSGPTFSQTIRWSGICRVRRLKGFLFVFMGPARAYCIPLRDLSEPDDLGRLLSMAGAHVDCR
ncbi:MAG TPA: YcxB family protein, partial [Verrucomicrobiae bacterium]|nr:YcxB family protein [Verrucomicrobiae bacterium]